MRKVMVLMAVAALMVALVAGTASAKQNGKGQGNARRPPARPSSSFATG